MANTLWTLTSLRFPEGVVCEIDARVPGTDCFLVDCHVNGSTSAYALDSELTTYGDDWDRQYSCDGWGDDR